MRRFVLPALLALAAVVLPAARAAELHVDRIDHVDCGFDSPYDVYVLPDGVRFQRGDGSPHEVFVHAGRLRVDGHALAVDAADADSLRQFEADVRRVLPQMAAIAREGVEIGFDAMTTVVATLTVDPDRRQSLVEGLNRRHAQALRRIDATLGRGQWRHDALREAVEDAVTGTVPELVGAVSEQAVKAALSGDQAQLASLQARADSLDHSIQRQVDARADRLRQQAQAMCPMLAQMRQLQQQWHVRLAGGRRLRLIRRSHGAR